MNALGVSNPDGEFITFKQASENCNLSIEMTKKLAREAQAVIVLAPRVQRVDAKKFYSYLREHYTQKSDE